jgi:hypothetical protein
MKLMKSIMTDRQSDVRDGKLKLYTRTAPKYSKPDRRQDVSWIIPLLHSIPQHDSSSAFVSIITFCGRAE